MCFHSMERKKLQALCKKHKIPSNLSNLEMANRLKEYFKEKDKPPIQGPVYGQDDEIISETGCTNMVIDFHTMKRRELQSLCQKHNIPANLPNVEMANRLKEYLKEKEKPPIQGQIYGQDDEITSETECSNKVIDFHSMKRRELQSLCQKHNIPANLPNLEMANRLKEYFKEKEKPPIQGLVYGPDDEITIETECATMVIDFHSMKRRELQALCQKHNIPANLPNLEMAKSLAEFFMEKEKSQFQGPTDVFDEIVNETDSTNMVMDFHSMKRKDLQVLCQKQNIPANLSNLEMAKRLSEFFKETEKPSIQGLINEQDENATMTRKNKKVRFSSEHGLSEITRSPELKRKSGLNSVSVRPSNLSVETVDNSITSRENVDRQGRVMRSRGSELTEGHVNETKRGKKGVNFDEQQNNVSTVEKTDNGRVTGRVLRSEGKELADDDVKNATKRGKAKIEENVLDDVDDEKSIEEIVTKTKRVRRAMEIVDNVPIVSDEAGDKIVVTRRSSRNKGVLEKNEATEVHRAIEQHIIKSVPEKKEAAEVHPAIEPQITVRRSKRNANAVGDSQVLNDDTRKRENDGVKGSRKSAKLLAGDDAKGEKDGVVQIEADDKIVVTRRSSRNKEVLEKNEATEVHRAIEQHIIKSVPEKNEAAEVHPAIESQIMVRRSKRNANAVGDSQVLNDDTRKRENDGVKGSRKSAKLLAGDDAKDEKDGGVVQIEADDKIVVTRRSSRNKEVLEKNEATEVHRAIEQHIIKSVPEKNEAAEVHQAIESQIMVRRSKRNTNTIGDTQVLNDDTRKRENDGVKGSRKSAKLLAEDDAKGEKSGGVIQIEKPVKLEVRRSDRRKSVVALPEKEQNGERIAKTENMRNSVSPLVIADGVSNIGKKVSQSVTRWSRRKTTIPESVYSEEKLDTDEAVENCETEKCLSPRRSSRVASSCKSLENKDELGGDTITRRKITTLAPVAIEEQLDTGIADGNSETEKSLSSRRSSRVGSFCRSMENKDEVGGDTTIQQKNEPRKRKRGPILEGDVKTDNVWSSSKQSMEESRNKKSVTIVEPQLSGPEQAQSSGDTKNLTSDVGLGESNRKTFREEQDLAITESAEMNFIDGNEFVNSVENATSRIAELETDLAESENQISASNIKDVRKVDSLEFDVQDIVEQDNTNMDKNQSGDQLFSPVEDSSHVDTIDSQILEEGSNVYGNEGFDEPSSAADRVLPADLVDHVGEVEGVSVQENLDSIEIGEANVISSAIACRHNILDHIEASNGISLDNNEDTGEVGAPESRADPDVTEAEADTGTQPGSNVADHAGEVEAISVQNADHLEASNSNFDDNKDGASEAREIGTPELRERCIEYTDSKSALHLKETPSGKLGSIQGDNAEIENGGCSKEQKIASGEDDEFGVADLFSGERSVGISSQDRGMVSGEYSAMKSDQQLMNKEYPAKYLKTTSPNVANICPETDHEAEHTYKGEESCTTDKSIHPEVAKTDGYGSSYCHENQEFVMSNILDVERRDGIVQQDGELLCGKNSVVGFDEEGMEIKLETGHEAHQISEGDEAENNDNHENRKDEDWEFSVSNLFDSEKSDTLTLQDREIFSAEESNNGFNEQLVFDVIPVVPTMHSAVEIGADSSSLMEICPSKPHIFSKSPDTGAIISDAREIIGNESNGPTNPEKEVAIVQNNKSDGDHEIFNQADEHTNECTPIQAEQPKSPLAITNAISNTVGTSDSKTTGLAMCKSQTCGKETTSPVVQGSDANEDGNDGNSGKDKDKLADACITDVDMSMDCTVSKSGVESLCELEFHRSEDTVHHESSKLDEKHTLADVSEQPNDLEPCQSLKDIELSNILEATVNDITPTGLNDTTKNSDVNSGNNVIDRKAKEMEGERGEESAKTTYVNAFLPANKEISDSGSGVNKEDYQLRLLFATPIKIDSASKVDKTSSHENESDRADKPVTKCVSIAVENSAAQINSDEKVRDVENELENSLCPSSNTGEKINHKESNEVDSVESMNTSGLGLSEASEKHLTENAYGGEGLKKHDFITEENMEEGIISPGQSSLFEEAADNECGLKEENTISLFGSLRNLDKVEGCQDILMDTDLSGNLSSGNIVCHKSEKKMALSSGAEFEISGADIQKSSVLENSHRLTGCYEDNNVSETLIDTLEGPMDAQGADIGSFNGEKGETGTSPSLFPNDDDGVTERKEETGDDIDPYKAEKWDEEDDDSRPLPDISDEPHCNSEVAILKSPSAGNNLELQSTYKETSPIAQNIDSVLSAAEQGFSVRGAEFDEISNLATHISLGDTENGDSEKSEKGTPVYNSEGGGHEKKSEGIDKNCTATKVQFSISELHLEQNVLDSNNAVHSVSNEVAAPLLANENCYVEKSDVATPLLNLEGDDKKYDAAAFGCNEFLKEIDVADTIKEYIDSEMAFMNEVAVCEDGIESEKLQEKIPINLDVGGYTADKSLVDTESEGKTEEMPIKESFTGNSGSAGNDAFLLQKEEIESREDGAVSSSRQLCPSMTENARTILIHGTPSKAVTTVDMKENGAAYKSTNIGDVTAPRQPKRKALQDVKWK